jgi:hypothetical protein
MSRFKRITLWSLGVLIVFVALAAAARVTFRPQMPSSWRSLHAGMSRSEILAVATGEHRDMHDLKGFDTFTVEMTMLGAPSYWQLLVTYDQSGRVMHADSRFVHRSCGLLSRGRPQSVL